MQANIKVNWEIVDQITKLSFQIDDLLSQNNPDNTQKIAELDKKIEELQKQRYAQNAK